MNYSSISEENYQKIKNWMEKEIGLMRELLSNFLEEELALVMWDEINWNKVISERMELIRRLKMLRQDPAFAKAPKIDLDEYFDLDLLHEQMTALTEKMALQNLRNKKLFKACGPNLGKPLPENWQQKLEKPAKKRIRVTTIED